jgi:hypothetical protein
MDNDTRGIIKSNPSGKYEKVALMAGHLRLGHLGRRASWPAR